MTLVRTLAGDAQAGIADFGPAFEIALVPRVTDRLQRKLVDTGTFKTAAAALQLADDTSLPLPAAVVYLLSDTGDESVAAAVGAIQNVTATLAVSVGVRSTNDPRGGRSVDTLAEAVGATRRTLNGWRPAPDEQKRAALQWRRGRILRIADNRALWQDEYTIEWRAQTVQED